MYAALDIGLKEDEERTLSPGMENLLAHMISAGRTQLSFEGVPRGLNCPKGPKGPSDPKGPMDPKGDLWGIWFEPGKIVRFDPNLDFNLTFFQA